MSTFTAKQTSWPPALRPVPALPMDTDEHKFFRITTDHVLSRTQTGSPNPIIHRGLVWHVKTRWFGLMIYNEETSLWELEEEEEWDITGSDLEILLRQRGVIE